MEPLSNDPSASQDIPQYHYTPVDLLHVEGLADVCDVMQCQCCLVRAREKAQRLQRSKNWMFETGSAFDQIG